MSVCVCLGVGCAKQKAWWVRTRAEAESISMSHQRRNNAVADGDITALWGSVSPPLSSPLSFLLSFCLHVILSCCFFILVVCPLISNCLSVSLTFTFSYFRFLGVSQFVLLYQYSVLFTSVSLSLSSSSTTSCGRTTGCHGTRRSMTTSKWSGFPQTRSGAPISTSSTSERPVCQHSVQQTICLAMSQPATC